MIPLIQLAVAEHRHWLTVVALVDTATALLTFAFLDAAIRDAR